MKTPRAATMLLGLIGASLLCCVAMAVVLSHIDLRPVIAWWARTIWDRSVSVGGMHVALGDPIVVSLDDLRMAASTAAGAREVARVDHLRAELLPWPLLRGALVFRHMSIAGVTIALDHHARGDGTRDVAKAAPAGTGRTGLPTILDLVLSDGTVTILTSGGNRLRIAAKTLALHTTGDDAPVNLTAGGAYGSTPIQLDGVLQSFARMRDAAAPFGVAITAKAAAATLSLQGTLTDPMHADGLSGDLRADFEKLDAPLAIAGSAWRPGLPLTLAGPIRREGVVWTLPALAGELGGSAYTGSAAITEGGLGENDMIRVTLALARLDVDKVLTGASAEARLDIDPNPGTLWDARLGAGQVRWGGVQMGQSDLHVAVTPGKIAVSDASVSLAGGKLTGSGEAVAANEGIAVASHAAVAELDLASLLRMTGAGSGKISGRVAGRMDLALTGRTLSDALGAAHGQAMLAITKGQVARVVLQAASTDLGILFHQENGMSPMLCFLAVASVRDGIAALSPLRMRTPEGTMIGGGSVDLRRRTLDITVQTLSGTTGFFALDLPGHITGPLADPNLRPGIRGETSDFAAQSAGNVRQLPPDMVRMVTENPCAQ